MGIDGLAILLIDTYYTWYIDQIVFFFTFFSCEVIRDRQTGDSLQYAFIEFADRKSCEEAYFKMDNVLIDDRRIHVDFSQSVAKMRWKGKGKGVQYFDDEADEVGNENLEKVISKHKQRDEPRSKEIEHRKYERIKDANKARVEYAYNRDKYIEKEKYKVQRYRDSSRERYEYESRRRKESKRRSRDKSRDRSRDRSERESYREHKQKKKSDGEKKRWDRGNSGSSNEDLRYEKHKDGHSSYKKKRTKNRSVERYEKSEKYKQKRR